MLIKPIKDDILLETNELMGNYFNHYKVILGIYRISFFVVIFIYYAICALNLLYAFVLLLFVFIEVAGKYIV